MEAQSCQQAEQLSAKIKVTGCPIFNHSFFTVNRFAIHLGVPSIAGPPSLKNDPPDRFIRFTLSELLKYKGVPHSAECGKGAALDLPKGFIPLESHFGALFAP